jgi:hypothetical protein
MPRMLGFLKSLLPAPPAPAAAREPARGWVAINGGFEFPLEKHMALHNGFPIPDWEPARAWVDSLDAGRREEAWTACERAWLLHFRDALGPAHRLDESATAALVSSLEPNVARAALAFMERTARRIGMVLKGLVEEPSGWGKDILILFDDDESYYRYASHYYPETGEFATSGGMHLAQGCSHFISVKRDLRELEAMIVHEMTHASLHLPVPLWLNEGLAVNTEHRLAGAPNQPLGAHDERHERLRRFWSVVAIQSFWSGESFHRPGESNELSYELARIVVEQLAKDWEPFARFVRGARAEDAGAAAAREHLGLDLGEVVTALLERDTPKSWSPDPSRWEKP